MTAPTSVDEARQLIHEKRYEGVRCPCCDSYIRVYARTITRSQVHFLRDLYRAQSRLPAVDRPRGLDVRKLEGQHMRGGDYSKLRLWGLIERGERGHGHWYLTGKGVQWLRGRIRVPRYAYVDRGELVRFSAEQLSVHDAHRETFDLDELLDTPVEAA